MTHLQTFFLQVRKTPALASNFSEVVPDALRIGAERGPISEPNFDLVGKGQVGTGGILIGQLPRRWHGQGRC